MDCGGGWARREAIHQSIGCDLTQHLTVNSDTGQRRFRHGRKFLVAKTDHGDVLGDRQPACRGFNKDALRELVGAAEDHRPGFQPCLKKLRQSLSPKPQGGGGRKVNATDSCAAGLAKSVSKGIPSPYGTFVAGRDGRGMTIPSLDSKIGGGMAGLNMRKPNAAIDWRIRNVPDFDHWNAGIEQHTPCAHAMPDTDADGSHYGLIWAGTHELGPGASALVEWLQAECARSFG